MFDITLESWYVWLGVCVVSVAVAGTALAVPTAAPPTAAPVADAVDSVAASSEQAHTTVDVTADRMRLSRHAIALRTDGGTAHARLAFGPVTPAERGRLRRVLHGTPPERVFISKQRFVDALEAARSAEPRWREPSETLTVRRVTWGDVDATLLG